MREFIRVFADIGVAIVLLTGVAGVVAVVMGALVLIEGGSSDGQQANQTFVAFDAWFRNLQTSVDLAPGKMFGSYGLALGAKLLVVTAAAGALLDIMYSLRAIADTRRR